MASVPEPKLGQGVGVTIERWLSWREPEGRGRAVSACFGMDVPTWVDEAMPIALERVAATAGATATELDPSIVGLHVAREETTATTKGEVFVRTGDDTRHEVLRTVVGFAAATETPHVTGCFLLCAPSTEACEVAAAAAPLLGFTAPPRANALARSLVFGVHHPRVVVASGAALFMLVGVVAVWTRPRPRRRRRRNCEP
jgi:hypothetical protein